MHTFYNNMCVSKPHTEQQKNSAGKKNIFSKFGHTMCLKKVTHVIDLRTLRARLMLGITARDVLKVNRDQDKQNDCSISPHLYLNDEGLLRPSHQCVISITVFKACPHKRFCSVLFRAVCLSVWEKWGPLY